MAYPSTPRTVFGIHSASFFSRVDGSCYGMMKLLESSTIAISGAHVDLYGGSNHYAWSSEIGEISAEMALKMGAVPDFAFTLFFGKAPTATTAEATGNIGTATNFKGSSVIAATGLVTPTLTSASSADLKFGKYTIIATSSTAYKLYISSDIDLQRGTSEPLLGDDNLIATVTGVATTVGQAVTGFGLTLTGGASATAFVTGDSAVFYVRPVSTANSVVSVGSSLDVFPEFSAIVMAQHKGSDEMMEIEALRCKAAGMPLDFAMFQWAKPEVKIKLLYDATNNAVFKMRYVAPIAI